MSKGPSDQEQPWYKDGLRFECTGCGKCCTGAPGYVWVTEQEIQTIAETLGITPDEFKQRYTKFAKGRYSILDDPSRNYDCVFLDGKACRIYKNRPQQCRTFPWWSGNLKSPEAWKEAARECEGIRDDAPVVAFGEIQRQLEKNG